MHELPQDLASSLRSYRGSVYEKRRGAGGEAAEDVDLEKGTGVREHYHEKRRPSDSSLVLQDGEQHSTDYEDIRPQHFPRSEPQRHSRYRPHVETNIQHAPSHPTAETPGKQEVFQAPPVNDPDPAADRLARDYTALTPRDFHLLMGLEFPGDSADENKPPIPKELAVPHGLFDKILGSLKWTHHKYRVFAIAVYILLLLQLMISAVFIILGALPHLDAHVVIAVLGAVSTVIAGGLALMQGQGLPNRLRMGRDSLRMVVFEAEEMYWDMRSGRPILYRDVRKLREDYLRVLEEQTRNHPDAWNSMKNRPAQGVGNESRVPDAVFGKHG